MSKCASCYAEGRAICPHSLQSPSYSKPPEPRTIKVKMLAYVAKDGGRIHMMPEHADQPSNMLRTPGLDQIVELPSPHEETRVSLLQAIMTGLRENMPRSVVADGDYIVRIHYERKRPMIAVSIEKEGLLVSTTDEEDESL